MISEVVPAPKVMMFFALFNTVGKTSGFIGPFISSAIIKRANGNTNAAYWFLLPWVVLALSCCGSSIPTKPSWTMPSVSYYLSNVSRAKYADMIRILDLEREAAEYYSAQQREEAKETEMREDQEKS